MKSEVVLICLLVSAISCSKKLQYTADANTRHAFDALTLKPAFEHFDWRIDLLRQQTTSTDALGNCQTNEVSYHPIGFDLGNNLFLDVKGNLSLRADGELSVDTKKDFKLGLINRSGNIRYVVKKGADFYSDRNPSNSYLRPLPLRKANAVLNNQFKTGRVAVVHDRKVLSSYKVNKVTDSLYTTKEFLNHSTIHQTSDGSIHVDKHFIIKHRGHMIEWYDRHRRLGALVKSADQYIVLDQKNRILSYIQKDDRSLEWVDSKEKLICGFIRYL